MRRVLFAPAKLLLITGNAGVPNIEYSGTRYKYRPGRIASKLLSYRICSFKDDPPTVS